VIHKRNHVVEYLETTMIHLPIQLLNKVDLIIPMNIAHLKLVM